MIEYWNSLHFSQQVFGPILLIIAAVTSQKILTGDKRAKKRAKAKEPTLYPLTKPSTVQRCKNPECSRLVSVRKITGDYCAFCHWKHVPSPHKINQPREVKTAIPKEVIDHE